MLLMENNTVTIQKIPLNNFIDVLIDLYNRGVDFIDIVGTQGEDKDYMGITFSNDYMSEEAIDNFENDPMIITKEDITNHKLSEKDINDLI
jgi:hypothetical protein